MDSDDAIRLAVVIGTRPEAIKLMPLIVAARGCARPRFDVQIIATGQHRELLSGALERFGVVPDFSLEIMTHNQTSAAVTSRALDALYPLLGNLQPKWLMVQGDTSSTFAGALAAFYHRIPIAHVEAGLRTDDIYSPFPEEGNRRMTTRLTELHFAPTEQARENLCSEGVDEGAIWVTGNTGVDALRLTLGEAPRAPQAEHPRRLLLTVHRRENHGPPLERICRAVLRLLAAFPSLRVVYPVHPNPNVKDVVPGLLGDHPRIELTEPLGYEQFLAQMQRAHLILTDSGGVQEEAPALDKPVLVLRENTERPEGVAAGTARLVGTDEDTIVAQTTRLLTDSKAYRRMASAVNPYGDGHAAARILDVLLQRIGTHRRD